MKSEVYKFECIDCSANCLKRLLNEEAKDE
jgi:hypothetical protein